MQKKQIIKNCYDIPLIIELMKKCLHSDNVKVEAEIRFKLSLKRNYKMLIISINP